MQVIEDVKAELAPRAYPTSDELRRGQALVLFGPKGCGKTTIALKIAAQYGPFVETDARRLEKPGVLNDLLESEPRAVICDGIPKTGETFTQIKAMIADKINGHGMITVMANKNRKTMATPNFIFCTSDPTLFPIFPRVATDWLFHVIDL